MKKPSGAKLIGGLVWLLMLAAGNLTPISAQENAPARVLLPTDRTVLPIPEPQYLHSTVFNARNATPPPRFEVKAPANAPNILIVLLDDMGFGQSSAFEGPIATGRIGQTQCCAFSADEGADVGADEGTPVTEDYQVPFKFTGKIDKVTIDLKETTQSAAIETGKARREAVLKRALSD